MIYMPYGKDEVLKHTSVCISIILLFNGASTFALKVWKIGKKRKIKITHHYHYDKISLIYMCA